MKAKNREHYIETWQDHIKQIVHLALAADVDHAEWTATRARLLQWVQRAADTTFPEEG